MGLKRSLCTKSWLDHLLYVEIWLSRNDMVFNNTRAITPMQVIFRVTHWIRFWALLQKEDERPHVIQGCRVFETTSMEIFATNGGRLITELVLDNFEFVPKTVLPLSVCGTLVRNKTTICIVLCRCWNIEIYCLF
jgi:hypothetical protein